MFFLSGEACGPYGHDINLREVCAAWRRPPDTAEMTKADFDNWQKIEAEIEAIKARKEREEILRFKSFGLRNANRKRYPLLESLALTKSNFNSNN